VLPLSPKSSLAEDEQEAFKQFNNEIKSYLLTAHMNYKFEESNADPQVGRINQEDFQAIADLEDEIAYKEIPDWKDRSIQNDYNYF